MDTKKRLSRDTRIAILVGQLNDVKYNTKEGSLKLKFIYCHRSIADFHMHVDTVFDP